MHHSQDVANWQRVNGELATYCFPGGYPLLYLDGGDNVLCSRCADASIGADYERDRPVHCAVNWETPTDCTSCGEVIECAYPKKIS
jgi:hypothetical protein